MTEPAFHESRVSIGHGAGRTPERLVIVGVVLLVLLVIKPWGGTVQPATAPVPVRSAAPTPEVLRYLDLPCASHVWLIEADTRFAGQIVRSWILTEAVEAFGPTDPDIEFVTVAAQQVLAIGYCPSRRDDARPHDRLTIYRLDPTVDPVGTTITPVITTPVQVPREAEAAANELFAPMSAPGPSGQAPGVTTWSPGRYVIRIEGDEGYERWLGVEVRIVELPEGSPAASEAP